MKGKYEFEIHAKMSSKEVVMVKFLKESFEMQQKFAGMTETGPKSAEVETADLLEILKPVIIRSKSRSIQKFYDGYKPCKSTKFSAKHCEKEDTESFDALSQIRKQLEVQDYLSQKWYELQDNPQNFIVIQLKDANLLQESILNLLHQTIDLQKLNGTLNKSADGNKDLVKSKDEGDFDAIKIENPNNSDSDEAPKRQLGVFGVYEHFRWLTLKQIVLSESDVLQLVTKGTNISRRKYSIHWAVHNIASMPRLDTEPLLDLHALDLSQVFGSIKRLNHIFEMENSSNQFSIHPFFTQSDSSSENSQLSSNEGIKFYQTFNLEFALVFRPDVLFFFIKDIYRSFQRYIDQVK